MEWRKSEKGEGEGVWNWKDQGHTLNKMESIRIERENGGEEEGKFTILEDGQEEEEKEDGQDYLVPYAERRFETGGLEEEEKAKEEREENKENKVGGGTEQAQSSNRGGSERGKNLTQLFKTLTDQVDEKPIRQKKVRFAENWEDSGFFG